VVAGDEHCYDVHQLVVEWDVDLRTTIRQSLLQRNARVPRFRLSRF
jgi:hypothetical protein